jgi:hypothetical protein
MVTNHLKLNGRVRRRIFELLCANPHGLTLNELVKQVYDGPSGGPLDASNTIYSAVISFNKWLMNNRRAMRIRNHATSCGRRYQIWIVRPGLTTP